jgi:hypothetical protein
MRANYNRQTRRASRCIRTRSSHRRRDGLAISPRGVVLTAYGHDLARLAASIADEVELSGEVIDHLLSPYGRMFEEPAQMPR